MKPVQKPPDSFDLLVRDTRKTIELFQEPKVKELIQRANDKYLHWHEFRHRPMPMGLNSEFAWQILKLSRSTQLRHISLETTGGKPFGYWLPDSIQKELHFIDQNATGQILLDEPTIGEADRDKYVINSLMEEAIASSILEGAATTRQKAKEMLREGRKPRTASEQMILNNYATMRKVREYTSQPLSIEMLNQLQASMTEGTLEDPTASGRFRKPGEEIRVVDIADGKILYTPPPATELTSRLQILCNFANETSDRTFIHPVVRGIIMHFWLAYEHPFNDGNGRTARALFYWHLLKNKYWLIEYIPISRIFLKAPSKYKKAFLYSETDEEDLTYFIHFNVRALSLAIEELRVYILRKQKELREASRLMRRVPGLNHRQQDLLHHAFNHPHAIYTIMRHMRTQGVVYQTARADLLELTDRSLFTKVKQGKTYYFVPHEELAKKVKVL
ncbi:MAG: Fic family protein [Bacteroidota bacterium]